MPEDPPVSPADIYQAYLDCRKRKHTKRGAVKFERYSLHNCAVLAEEINRRRYRLRPSQCFIVEYPVAREVFCAAFRDRVVQHFVYNELNPVIESILINDTCSCRRDKGTDYAIRRLARFIRKATLNWTDLDAWAYKLDIAGFFMSIDRQKLLEMILDVIWNRYTGSFKHTLDYLVRIIILTDVTVNSQPLCSRSKWNLLKPGKTLFGNKNGLPIGNISSQLFANYYLNQVDHFIKSRHEGYVRYVDDMVIVDRDKEKLKATVDELRLLLPVPNLRLNEHKSNIFPIRYGVTFLGVRVKPFYSVLAGRRIDRLWHGLREFSDPYKAFQSASSRKGMFTRYKGRRIAARWYAAFPEEIRKVVKMDSDTTFRYVGPERKRDNTKAIEIDAAGCC